MANSYLIQASPWDSKPTRKAIQQQWIEAMAVKMKAVYGGSTPTTGGYLIDTDPNTSKPDQNCATVAWYANAATNA